MSDASQAIKALDLKLEELAEFGRKAPAMFGELVHSEERDAAEDSIKTFA